jgi:hypothetical protein
MTSKPKILAISQYGYVGLYRVDNPLDEMQRRGLANIHLVFPPHMGGVTDRDLERYDIVITNRQHADVWESVIARVKRRSRTLFVHDVDDQEFIVPTWNPARPQFSQRGNKTQRTLANAFNMAACDLITVSTSSLVNDAQWFNKDVALLPNQIQPRQWKGIIPMEHEGEVWMGFLGSNTHRKGVEMAAEGVTRALEEWDTLYLIVAGYPEILHLFPDRVWPKIRAMPFDFGQFRDGKGNYYKRWLLSCDFVIRPSDPSRFSSCKSDNPMLEAGAIGFSRGGVGVPIVVSPWTYGETAKLSGQLVATDGFDWYACISRMVVGGPDYREYMGRLMFEYVAGNRLESMHFQKRFDAYCEAYGGLTWPIK